MLSIWSLLIESTRELALHVGWIGHPIVLARYRGIEADFISGGSEVLHWVLQRTEFESCWCWELAVRAFCKHNTSMTKKMELKMGLSLVDVILIEQCK